MKRAFEPGTWVALSPRIRGDTMLAVLHGVPAEPFRSSGVAHAEKRNVALVVSGREAHVDHLKIRSTPWRPSARIMPRKMEASPCS